MNRFYLDLWCIVLTVCTYVCEDCFLFEMWWWCFLWGLAAVVVVLSEGFAEVGRVVGSIVVIIVGDVMVW